MSEEKHTPGPWTIGTKSKHGTHNPNIIYCKGGSGSVCQMFNVPMHCDLEELAGEERWAEGLANARLIAAAPDLYRELEHLVSLMEPLEREGSLDIPGLATLNGARAALTKATTP